jgi:hypothetical protein
MPRGMEFAKLFYLSLAVGAMSMTISKAKLFRATRRFIARKSESVGELIECPYCIGHWLSFVLAAIYFPRVLISRCWILDWFVSAMATVALSAVTCKLIDWTYSFSEGGLKDRDADALQEEVPPMHS